MTEKVMTKKAKARPTQLNRLEILMAKKKTRQEKDSATEEFLNDEAPLPYSHYYGETRGPENGLCPCGGYLWYLPSNVTELKGLPFICGDCRRRWKGKDR